MSKFLWIALLMPVLSAFGQDGEHYDAQALYAYQSKDYPAALLYAELSLSSNDENVTALFIAGESATRMNDLEKAENYLEKISDKAKIGFFASTDYYLGLIKQKLGKRDEAIKYYEQYLDKHLDENDYYSVLSESSVVSLVNGYNEGAADLTNAVLPGNVNSEAQELAPLRYADKLYFASLENENFIPTKDRKNKLKQHPVMRIYEAKYQMTAQKVDFNPQSVVLNATGLTLMPDASRMYYSLCSDDNYLDQQECRIWYRNRQYDGEWGPPVKLPEHINLRNYTQTQPSVGFDWTLKKYVLFFVSDRPGGRGGKDIWCTVLEDEDTFSEPFPLTCNTPWDEVTPFFHQASQTLFFSSDGLKGEGGLDVYKLKREDADNWGTPENLGAFINSKGDEMHYTYHSYSKRAYFVSNHATDPLQKNSRQTQNSYDIYESRVFIDFQMRVFDAIAKKPLNGVKVNLQDLNAQSTGTFSASKDRHDLHLLLEPGSSYRLEVQMPGYETFTMDLDTERISYFTEMDRNIFLRKEAQP